MFRPALVATGSCFGAAPASRRALLGSRNPRYHRGNTMSKKSPAAGAQQTPSATRFDAYSVREYEANGEKKSD